MMKRADLHISIFFTALLVLPGAASTPCSDGQEHGIARDTAVILDRPVASARLLGRVPRDSIVNVNMCADGWCHVTFRALSGFAPETLFAATRALPALADRPSACTSSPASTASSSGAELLQGLHEREGVRQQLHRSQLEMPSAARLRMQSR